MLVKNSHGIVEGPPGVCFSTNEKVQQAQGVLSLPSGQVVFAEVTAAGVSNAFQHHDRL